jgi:hypothetical protein
LLNRGRWRHVDLRPRDRLLRARGGHLNGGKKRGAGFGKLPAGVFPADEARAKDVKIRREC